MIHAFPTFSIEKAWSIGRTGGGAEAAASIDRMGYAIEEASTGRSCSAEPVSWIGCAGSAVTGSLIGRLDNAAEF